MAKDGKVKLLPSVARCLVGYKEDGKFKLPTTPAECADILYLARQERLDTQKVVDVLDKLETAIEQFFINALPKKGASGIAGKVARAQIKPDPIEIVEDWDKVYAHIKRTGSWDLLQRRINAKAFSERREQGSPVPGSKLLPHQKVSCTKL